MVQKLLKYAVFFRKVPVVMVILPAGTALAAERDGLDALKPLEQIRSGEMK